MPEPQVVRKKEAADIRQTAQEQILKAVEQLLCVWA
jgi:hypothetical protein